MTAKTRAKAPEVSETVQMAEKVAVNVINQFSAQYGIPKQELRSHISDVVNNAMSKEFVPAEIRQRVEDGMLRLMQQKANPVRIVQEAQRGKVFPQGFLAECAAKVYSGHYGVTLKPGEASQIAGKVPSADYYKDDLRNTITNVKSQLLERVAEDDPRKALSLALSGHPVPTESVARAAVEVYGQRMDLTEQQAKAIASSTATNLLFGQQKATKVTPNMVVRDVQKTLQQIRNDPKELAKFSPKPKPRRGKVKAPKERYIAMLTFSFPGDVLMTEEGEKKLPAKEFRVYFKVRNRKEMEEIEALRRIDTSTREGRKEFQAKAYRWFYDITVYRQTEDPSTIIGVSEGIGGGKTKPVYLARRDNLEVFDKRFVFEVGDYRAAGLEFDFDQFNTRAIAMTARRKKPRAPEVEGRIEF